MNVRVRPPVKQGVDAVCNRLDYTRDDVVEVAMAALFGSTDGVMREKRKKIQEVARQMKIALSFNRDGFSASVAV